MKNQLLSSLFTTLLVSLASSSVSANAEILSSSRIDQIYSDLLQTETLKPLLSTVFGCSAEHLVKHTRMSLPTATSFMHNCKTLHAPAQKLSILPRIYFIKRENNRHITSWTSINNVTEIILAQDEALSDTLLAQIFVHELSVYFDGKSLYGYYVSQGRSGGYANSLDYGWMLVTPAGGRDHLTEHALMDALNEPFVHYAMAALRGFALEKKVLKDLVKMQSQKHQLNGRYRLNNSDYDDVLEVGKDKSSCVVAINRMYERNSHEFYLRSIRIPWTTPSTGLVYSTLHLSYEKLSLQYYQALGRLIHAVPVITAGGMPQNLCSYMSEPELSSKFSALTTGPRPRLSGGSGW